MVMNTAYHVFVHDFVAYTIGLPKEFYDLKLETDCYEAPFSGSEPGALTPTNVWNAIIEYARNFYNIDKAIEIWTPRGCNTWIDKKTQIFKKYHASKRIWSNKPILCIFPRGRDRSSFRNVPEFVWYDLVEKLKDKYQIVLSGTVGGSSLVDYEDPEVINLIPEPNENKLDTTIDFLGNSIGSISSQSGLTHVSLLTGCPSIIIGHEKQRHAVDENRTDTPVSFRYVTDYRAIDADTIIQDMNNFFGQLQQYNLLYSQKIMELRPSLRSIADNRNMVGAEIGVFDGKNSERMLEILDIDKLYLIDPYKIYKGCKDVAGISDKKKIALLKNDAHARLERFKDKVIWVEDLSENAIENIEEELDFVYIDGNHTYDFVKKDVKLYSRKIKEGGLIAGHDYENIDVKRAVNELIGKVSIGQDPQDSRTNDWWIFKPHKFDNILMRDANILAEFGKI